MKKKLLSALAAVCMALAMTPTASPVPLVLGGAVGGSVLTAALFLIAMKLKK